MIERRRYVPSGITRASRSPLDPRKRKRERERYSVQRAACAILAHPGVTARSAGRWFANYLNLPKPQPRRPRKPQLPSSWPPLDTHPFPPFYPQFLSSSRRDLHPTIRFLSACLPAHLSTYLTLLSSHACPRHCRVSVSNPNFGNLAGFGHHTAFALASHARCVSFFSRGGRTTLTLLAENGNILEHHAYCFEWSIHSLLSSTYVISLDIEVEQMLTLRGAVNKYQCRRSAASCCNLRICRRTAMFAYEGCR